MVDNRQLNTSWVEIRRYTWFGLCTGYCSAGHHSRFCTRLISGPRLRKRPSNGELKDQQQQGAMLKAVAWSWTLSACSPPAVQGYTLKLTVECGGLLCA